MYVQKIENRIASTKFAFVIILVFASLMAVGTFLESYYGTEFAGRAMYKSFLFMGVQGIMLLSIFYALLHRLPPRKNLYGFYTIHVGLILLFCSSFVTYYAGVDGQLTLTPENPARTVSLTRDMLTITEHENNEATYILPYTVSPTLLNESWKQITLKRYFPFSENHLQWAPSVRPSPQTALSSSQYLLFNDNVDQKLVMSLHPEALDFPPTTQLGPLKVHYLPQAMSRCFRQQNPTGHIFYNTQKALCFTPEEKNISIQKSHSGKSFLVVEEEGTLYSFFPNFSPSPLILDNQNKLQPRPNSPLRILSKKLFIQGPQLLLMGKTLAYHDDGQWIVQDFQQGPLPLPWMGFEIQLLRHEEHKIPQWVPHYQRPRQTNNQLTKGKQRALELEIQGQTHWVTSERPLSLLLDGQKYSFYLGHQTAQLPFEINLTRFKMDTDPGTNNPASYESFVNVFSPQGVSKHHIFMNNPLNFSNFTFYQASYFPLEDGRFGSVLSVNFDPGRAGKYGGSLLLVFGSLWHFSLRRKKLPVKGVS